jgi:5-methylcytosine-specific restriction protein B
MIRLFGIKYSEELKSCTCSMSEIAELAEIGINYHAEISKGIRLAKYVKIK